MTLTQLIDELERVLMERGNMPVLVADGEGVYPFALSMVREYGAAGSPMLLIDTTAVVDGPSDCPLCGEPIGEGDRTEESEAGTVHRNCQDGVTG